MSCLVEVLTVEDAPLLTAPFFAGGDPGPIAATLAHVPELLDVTLGFIGPVLSPSSIDWRTKEIAILRTSAQLSCRYCIDTHTPVALDSGLTHSQVAALRGEGDVDTAFAEQADRTLIGWIDAVATGRGPITGSVAEAARAAFTAATIVELTLLVGATMMLNRYATALGLPVNDQTIARLADEGFGR
jgi:AhpD family alkylhydroperoxidase